MLDSISYANVGISYAITIPVPVFDILGTVFAFRSMKLKETSWIGNVLGVIGLLTFIFILFVAVMIFTWK
jgi:protein-S-isoprenylcysteine O-methyltransferase Ste14